MAAKSAASQDDSKLPILVRLPDGLANPAFYGWLICGECRRRVHPKWLPMCAQCASRTGLLKVPEVVFAGNWTNRHGRNGVGIAVVEDSSP